MFIISKEGYGSSNQLYFVGMVYHGECGWHSGFTTDYNKEIIKYSTMEQATQQMQFLEEEYHEEKLWVEEE